MRAAVIDKPNEIHVGTVPDPEPAPGEVVVQVGACGICGSDLNIAAGHFPPTPFPIVPGHEFAGQVVALGAGVDWLAVGERVAVDPSLYCGHCEWCRIGRGNLCDNWGAIGDTVDGACAEFVSVPAVNCHRLPDHLSYQQGALVEPLSCAVHALDVLRPRVAERALVVGAGTMGLLTAQLIALSGTTSVTVVDRISSRLPLAAELGAHVVDTDVASAIEESGGYDIVVDASGSPGAMQAALDGVRKGGRFLVAGVAPPEATIAVSPFRIYNQELTILGSMAVLDSYSRALELLAEGTVYADPLLTHSVSIDGYPDALETVRRGEGVKVQIVPDAGDRHESPS
jgi:2-desacetyl-2-hydroxyethyl bacteriochlorophyllide A dehydrogenase